MRALFDRVVGIARIELDYNYGASEMTGFRNCEKLSNAVNQIRIN